MYALGRGRVAINIYVLLGAQRCHRVVAPPQERISPPIYFRTKFRVSAIEKKETTTVRFGSVRTWGGGRSIRYYFYRVTLYCGRGCV